MTQKKSQLQTAGEVLLPATGVAGTAYLTGLAYDEITGGESGRKLKNRRKLKEQRRSEQIENCLLYTSPSPRDGLLSRMPSSA